MRNKPLDRQRLATQRQARLLAHDAAVAAGDAGAGSSEWHFCRGVELCAISTLHPELEALRDDEPTWLASHRPAFRQGFRQARSTLAIGSPHPAALSRSG